MVVVVLWVVVVVVVVPWAMAEPVGTTSARVAARAIRKRKGTGILGLIASFLHQ
jgi:type II secretory pathway component PulK